MEKIKGVPLPEDYVTRMKEMLGADFGAFMDSYAGESAYGLRYNPLKAEREHFERIAAPYLQERIPWAAEGYACLREKHPGKQILHEAGAYYIQEPSAMSAAELLGDAPGHGLSGAWEGWRILDLCAAPGGKTTQIAGKLGGNGLLVANEYVSSRARILSQNVERFGVRNCVVLNEDPARLAGQFPCFFHRILVDAPCSGEGMFRKDEAARAEWSAERVGQCAARQLGILEHADKMLMPGGRMVYSTCTFSPAENEGVIACFLQKHPDYELIRPELCGGMDCGRPEWAAEYAGCDITPLHVERCVRLWPHKLKGEGHFAAILQKKGAAERDAAAYRRVQPVRDKEIVSLWERFACENLNVKLSGVLVAFGTNLYLTPESMRDLNGLKVERAGLHLGECKKNRFEPSHALALALKPQDGKCGYALSGDEAERYLRGETLTRSGALQGWTLLSYEGYTFGWGKAGGNQIKNHYPKGLRIMG